MARGWPSLAPDWVRQAASSRSRSASVIAAQGIRASRSASFACACTFWSRWGTMAATSAASVPSSAMERRVFLGRPRVDPPPSRRSPPTSRAARGASALPATLAGQLAQGPSSSPSQAVIAGQRVRVLLGHLVHQLGDQPRLHALVDLGEAGADARLQGKPAQDGRPQKEWIVWIFNPPGRLDRGGQKSVRRGRARSVWAVECLPSPISSSVAPQAGPVGHHRPFATDRLNRRFSASPSPRPWYRSRHKDAARADALAARAAPPGRSAPASCPSPHWPTARSRWRGLRR